MSVTFNKDTGGLGLGRLLEGRQNYVTGCEERVCAKASILNWVKKDVLLLETNLSE